MCEKVAFVMQEKVRLFKVTIKMLLLTCAMYNAKEFEEYKGV